MGALFLNKVNSLPIRVKSQKRTRKGFKRVCLVQSGKKKVLLEAINHPKFQNRKFRTGSSLLSVPHALLVVKCPWTKMLKVRRMCQLTDDTFLLLQGRSKVTFVSGILSFIREVEVDCPRYYANFL